LSPKFGKAHRKLIQCALAQSLYYLCDSPWLSECWNLRTLTFGGIADYVAADILEKFYAAAPLPEDLNEEYPQSPLSANFMTRFGLLLLQIEFKEVIDAIRCSNHGIAKECSKALENIRVNNSLEGTDLEDDFLAIVKHPTLACNIDDKFREVLDACYMYLEHKGFLSAKVEP
jgi:hypothetical protein